MLTLHNVRTCTCLLCIQDINLFACNLQSDEELGSHQAIMKESYKFCRVTLPDNSTTVLYAKPGQSVRATIGKLCDRRNINLASLEVLETGSDKVDFYYCKYKSLCSIYYRIIMC